jgi:hypothetical protein
MMDAWMRLIFAAQTIYTIETINKFFLVAEKTKQNN